MKKAVLESSLNLVISVIIIIFIVSVGYFQINTFLENRNNQLFNKGIIDIADGFEYLISTNSIGSFLQVNLVLPNNQSITFDNSSNNLTLQGAREENISLNTNLVNNLILNNPGTYELTLCYNCNTNKEFVVIFN